MKWIVTWVLYALVRVDCPGDSVDHSCFTREAIDTVRKEFKTIGAAKGYVTKYKQDKNTITVEGKELINGPDGFIEFVKIDSI